METIEATSGVVETSTTPFLPEGFSVGSRRIKIGRIDNYVFLPDRASDTRGIRQETTKKIGSTWKKGTTDIIRGLNQNCKYVDGDGVAKFVNEEKLYLPKILGINENSPNWEATVREYWANYSILVPLDDGIEIEAGFLPDGKPINLDGYMRYNFCMEHGKVATRPEELDNKDIFEFYIVDKYEEEQAVRKEFEERNKINKVYLKLIASTLPDEKAKVDYIIQLVGGKYFDGMATTKMDEVAKQMELERIKNERPALFVEHATDQHLATKALIRRAVFAGVITKEGDSYFMYGKSIGSTLLETVAFLDNKNNDEVRSKLIAALRENSK